jgi:hypothetical protein
VRSENFIWCVLIHETCHEAVRPLRLTIGKRKFLL